MCNVNIMVSLTFAFNIISELCADAIAVMKASRLGTGPDSKNTFSIFSSCLKC